MRSRTYRSLMLLALAFGALVLGSRALAAPADAESTRPAARQAPQGCGLGWRVVSSPNVGTAYNAFYGMEALSATDVWAVGYHYDDVTLPTRTLIEHWNGTSWTVVPSPNVRTESNSLYAVAAAAPNDVWAVGSFTNAGQARAETLIVHWDGSQWSVVPSPNVGSAHNVLYGLAVVAANDVWAVGEYSNGGYLDQTLVQHWDGNTWSVVPSPNIAGLSTSLQAVTALAANDVWAVGEYHPSGGGGSQTLALHWNGSAWTQVPSLTPGTSAVFYGVTGLAPNNVWAVGYYFLPGGPWQTLVEHWDGSAWAQVPSPNVGTGSNFLNAVAAVAANDIWAVGFEITYTFNGPSRTLILHWDGSAWSVAPSPNAGASSNILYGIAPVAATDVWAAGTYNNGNGQQTLVERYSSGPCVTPTFTPTQPPGPVTSTPIPPTGTPTPAPSPTPCLIQFTDVDQNNPFYPFVRCLACRGILSGYADGTFRWQNNVTRGQAAKIVANGAGYTNTIPSNQQLFADVPPSHPFWLYIERAVAHLIISGYTCGEPGEPCDPQNRPYFRPQHAITRGQLAKVVAEAAAYADPIPSARQTFADVPISNPFWLVIERAALHAVFSGYSCGGAGEPCDPQNRPYFRWGNEVTRGQTAKIVSNAFFPNCRTLQR